MELWALAAAVFVGVCYVGYNAGQIVELQRNLMRLRAKEAEDMQRLDQWASEIERRSA